MRLKGKGGDRREWAQMVFSCMIFILETICAHSLSVTPSPSLSFFLLFLSYSFIFICLIVSSFLTFPSYYQINHLAIYIYNIYAHLFSHYIYHMYFFFIFFYHLGYLTCWSEVFQLLRSVWGKYMHLDREPIFTSIKICDSN